MRIYVIQVSLSMMPWINFFLFISKLRQFLIVEIRKGNDEQNYGKNNICWLPVYILKCTLTVVATFFITDTVIAFEFYIWLKLRTMLTSSVFLGI